MSDNDTSVTNEVEWRICEFCRCRTNAHLRRCCAMGQLVDASESKIESLERSVAQLRREKEEAINAVAYLSSKCDEYTSTIAQRDATIKAVREMCLGRAGFHFARAHPRPPRQARELRVRFNVPKEEMAAFEAWFKEHHTEHGNCKMAVLEEGEFFAHGAIDGHLTWMFNATSLGDIITVKCSCGEEINLTEKADWVNFG